MFKPTNRNILVEIEKPEETQTDILLPTGSTQAPQFYVGKIVATAFDCSAAFNSTNCGKLIVFPSNMLQQVEISGEEVNLVSENYVLGYVEG
tara:strand:+ start:262 stop:537 length:276 start_codon:yes stop_codon:yes gene_type:complete